MNAGEIARIPARELWVAANEEIERLLDRYEQPLYAYLLTLVENRDVARDCTQDTFLRALEHMRRGKEINVRWLYTVARKRAIDHLRDRRRVGTDDAALEIIASDAEAEAARVTEI